MSHGVGTICLLLNTFFPFHFDWNSLHWQIFYENEFWIDHSSCLGQLLENLLIGKIIIHYYFIIRRWKIVYLHPILVAFLVSRVFEEMGLSPMEKSEQKKGNCFKAALNFKVDLWKGANVEPLETRMLHTTHNIHHIYQCFLSQQRMNTLLRVSYLQSVSNRIESYVRVKVTVVKCSSSSQTTKRQSTKCHLNEYICV